MTDRISTDELRKLLDEHHKGSLYSETLDRHKYDLAAEVISLREDNLRLRRAAKLGYDMARANDLRNTAEAIRAALNHKETE